jgi:drug/metabolite transporter (DMT)-like permease
LASPRWPWRTGCGAPPGEAPLSAHDRRLLFWESFLGNFLFSICMLYGVQLTSALAAGVTMAAIPAAVALLSRIFLGEHIRPRVLRPSPARPGHRTAGAGAQQRRGGGCSAGGGSLLGYALLLGAVLCEASYVVIGKRLTGNVAPRRISALINLWGLALVTPFGLWQAWSFDFAAVGPGTWALLLFYALAASMVTVWLWMQGLRHVPSSRAGVFTVLLPVSAALVGVVVLGEGFGAAHVAAFVPGPGGPAAGHLARACTGLVGDQTQGLSTTPGRRLCGLPFARHKPTPRRATSAQEAPDEVCAATPCRGHTRCAAGRLAPACA